MLYDESHFPTWRTEQLKIIELRPYHCLLCKERWKLSLKSYRSALSKLQPYAAPQLCHMALSLTPNWFFSTFKGEGVTEEWEASQKPPTKTGRDFWTANFLACVLQLDWDRGRSKGWRLVQMKWMPVERPQGSWASGLHRAALNEESQSTLA